MDCSIRCDIAASPARIWTPLTTANAFPSWNSTVTSLKGEIALGQKLELKVALDPNRAFKPKVTKPAFEAYAADLKRAAERGA
jgi:hypothetical protein